MRKETYAKWAELQNAVYAFDIEELERVDQFLAEMHLECESNEEDKHWKAFGDIIKAAEVVKLTV